MRTRVDSASRDDQAVVESQPFGLTLDPITWKTGQLEAMSAWYELVVRLDQAWRAHARRAPAAGRARRALRRQYRAAVRTVTHTRPREHPSAGCHCGFVGCEHSLEDLGDIYATPVPLKTMATQSAADGVTAAQLDTFGVIPEEMCTATPERYVELNHAFHIKISAAAADPPRLIRLIDMLRREPAPYVALDIGRYDEEYRRRPSLSTIASLSAARRHSKAPPRAVREHLEHHARHTADLLSTERGA